MDDAQARELIRLLAVWVSGFTAAHGENSPISPETYDALRIADYALLFKIQIREAVNTPPPPAPTTPGPSIVLQEHQH